MKPAAYFSRITPISLHDPLAELLGATEDGIITYDFLDAVKLAGHACPTVAGAWLATVRGLRALYGDDMPVRGNVSVPCMKPSMTGSPGLSPAWRPCLPVPLARAASRAWVVGTGVVTCSPSALTGWPACASPGATMAQR